MLEIVQHDSTIKEFLNDNNARQIISTYIASDYSSQLLDILLDNTLDLKYPLQLAPLAEKVNGIESSRLSTDISTHLNPALGKFSNKYNISPSIQLYFRTDNCNTVSNTNPKRYGQIGAHLACSTKNKSGASKTLKPIDDLKRMLYSALQKINHEFRINELDATDKEFRNSLRINAERALNVKLHERGISDCVKLDVQIAVSRVHNDGTILYAQFHDYRSLSVECFINERAMYQNPNRTMQYWNWAGFQKHLIYRSKERYLLSSDTGSGKTTFLRALQLNILDTTDLIPLFIDAGALYDMAASKKDDLTAFIKSISTLFTGHLFSGQEYDFLAANVDKLVFLIDGLDQMPYVGTAYTGLVDNLKSLFKDKLVISSRPFALVDRENCEEFKLLRLEPLSPNKQKDYFKQHYSQAKELCKIHPEMLGIPMFAYMVRLLVERRECDAIHGPFELYDRYVDYIFKNHYAKIETISIRQRKQILRLLKDISYKALVNNEQPYIQAIPYDFIAICVEKEKDQYDDIDIEMVLKNGLPSSLVNQPESNQLFIYFNHRSFQEYFAAAWLKEHPTLIFNYILEYAREKRFVRSSHHAGDLFIEIMPTYFHNILLLQQSVICYEDSRDEFKPEDIGKSCSEGVMAFLLESHGNYIAEEAYRLWQGNRSRYEFIEVFLMCYLENRNSLLNYKDKIYYDILNIINTLDCSVPEEDNWTADEISYLLRTIILLDSERASKDIYDIFMKYMRNEKEKESHDDIMKNIIPIADFAKEHIGSMLTAMLDLTVKDNDMITLIGLLSYTNTFSAEHLMQIIIYECQNSHELQKNEVCSLIKGINHRVITKYITANVLEQVFDILSRQPEVIIQKRLYNVLSYLICSDHYKDMLQRKTKVESLIESNDSLRKSIRKNLKGVSSDISTNHKDMFDVLLQAVHR